MNDIIKASVESRKAALFTNYSITDQKIIDKIEDYFNRLNEFASNYDDVTEFENDFSDSDLSKEYTDLFITLSKRYDVPSSGNVKEEIKDDITHRVRREVRQEAYDKVRDIPVIAEAMSVKQHFDFFSRFKKKKDE